MPPEKNCYDITFLSETTLSMQEVADKVAVPASCALHRRETKILEGF